MPENSKNDWLVATLSKPEFTLGDFEQLGLTPTNTQLLKETDYKKSADVQKLFTNPETGKFDETQFKQHYDVATQTYNDFAKKDYDSTALKNNYFFENNYLAPKDAKRYKETVNISKVKNPFNQVSGIEGFTTKTNSDLTVREIAQTQKVVDHLTNEEMDFTPNEAGFFGTMFKATNVLAQYDEDGEHYDADMGRKVKHAKGEYKYNANGKPYYETLGNREIYGKQGLGVWDVLTEDGSTANKWDFMDSDSRTKSLTGTIFKTTAQVLPMLLPGIGQWYTGLTLGHALFTDLLPVLAKSTTGLFLNEDLKNTGIYEYANALQGYGAKFAHSTSDEGKESMFNKENIFAMAGDVFGQLAQQRLIAKIPQWLGQTGKEAQAFSKIADKYGEELVTTAQKTLKTFKGPDALQLRANYLRNAFGSDEGIAKILNNYDKWASVGSKSLGVAYMSGISATGIAEEAKLQGLDERDTGALFLGTMAGFGVMMTKLEFGHWALKGLGLDDLGGYLKGTLKERIREIAPTINKIADANRNAIVSATASNVEQVVAGEAVAAGTEAAKRSTREKLISLFNKGKSIGKSLGEALGDIDTVKKKMLAEAVEETTEEAMQDGLKVVYNGLRALGLTSTDADKSKAFNFNDISGRYLMSALGGALGGGIAGVQDKLAGQIHGSLPESLKREIASAVRHGYGDNLQKLLDEQKKQGKLGSTVLSIKQFTPEYAITDEVNYEPMTEDNDSMSHNDFMHAMISAEIKLAKDSIFQEGLDSDVRLNDIYNSRTEMFVDYQLNTGIVRDIDNLTTKIIDARAAALEVQTQAGENTDVANAKLDIKNATKELDVLREEIHEIISGKRALQYTQEALFSINKGLHGAFGIETKDSMAYREYNKKYEHLSVEEKEDINIKYDEYVKLEKRDQLRQGHKEFITLNDEVTTSLPVFTEYAKQHKAFVQNYGNLHGALDMLQLLDVEETARGKKFSIKTLQEEDIDKIDNNTLNQLNLGPIVGDTEIPLITRLENLIKASPYLNPVLTEFIKSEFNKPYTFNEGFQLADEFDRIYVSGKNSLVPQEFEPTELNASIIKSFTGVDVNKLLSQLSPWNYEETIETLLEVVKHPEFRKMIESAGSINTGENPDFNLIVSAYTDAIKTITNSLMSKAIKDELGQVTYISDDEAIATIATINSIKKELLKKTNNPVLDLITKLTKRSGREGLSDLISLINSSFNDLTNKGAANDFIIDNKITVEQLEYGQNLLEKLSASIIAGITYENPTDKSVVAIGYNAASNKLAEKDENTDFKPLETIDNEYADLILNELTLLNSKIGFLLDLHQFNANGSIREMKMTGATMSTLFLKSLSPESELFRHIEALGVDMSDISTQFQIADQYKENLEAIESVVGNKKSLKSDDDSFHKIRAEKDKIEQAYYKAINSREDKVEILNKIFDTLPIEKYVVNNTNVNFSSNVRRLPEAQTLIYLAQTLTVNPKEFYRDFIGDLDKGENTLKDDKYAPFYGQEHVLKQMYWHMLSKMSPVDTFQKVANILLKPDTTLTEEETKIFREDLQSTTLKNACVLFGIPGAGKTTSALYYLAKIAERYNLNTAIFAPHDEQADRLKEGLKDRSNVYNEHKSVKSLMQNVLGDELYNQINSDYEEAKFETYKIGDPITEIPSTSTLMLQQGLTGYMNLVANPNNPLIIKFLADKAKTISYEGKVPSVIIIDEATHIRGVELELLNSAVGIHNTNSNQPISLFLVGDREQRGYSLIKDDNIIPNNIKIMQTIRTPVLSQSLRNRFNVKNKNINLIRALRSSVETASANRDFGTIKGLLDTGIVFDYVIDNNYGLVGEHLVSDFTKEDLEILFKNPNETVALITDTANGQGSPSLLKLIESIPGAKERLTVHSPDKIQGLEYDNIIIDIRMQDKRPINIREVVNTYDSLEMLYTMVSRSKKGSLIKDSILKGISLKDNTQDVIAQKIELDVPMIDKYKAFTEKGITDSFNELEDLDLNPKSARREPTVVTTEGLTATTDDKVFEDEGFKIIQKQIETPTEDVQKPIDFTGETTEIEEDETRPLTYSFHERLGVVVDNKLSIQNTKNNPIVFNKDLAAVYNLMNSKSKLTLTEGLLMTDDKVKAAREQLNRLKTGLMAYAKNIENNINVGHIKGFLFTRYNVNSSILDSLNFDKATLKIETKEFDPLVDTSYAHRAQSVPSLSGGLISYLVLNVPRMKGDESIFLTITAFPNTNNPNVKKLKGVMNTMNLIRDKHTQYAASNKSDFYFKPTVSITSVLNPSSNLYLRSTPNKLFSEFKNSHRHLSVSEPYIIMNTNIISQDDRVVQEMYASFNRGGVTNDGKINSNSANLIGRPVIFVSLDKTKTPNQLADLYVKQLNAQTLKRLKGESLEPSPGDIRMVLLNKRGIKFNDWLDKNLTITQSIDETGIDLKAQRRAYGNNFAAATMIANLINFKRRAEYHKANSEPNSLRAKLKLKENTYGPARLNNLIAQVDAVLKTAIPLITGRTFDDIYLSGNATGGKSTVDNYITAARADIDSFIATTFKDSSNAKEEAILHFIATDLLKYATKHENEGINQKITDVDDKNLKLNIPNSSLYNFVNAIRLTIAGGNFTDKHGVNFRIDGLFPSAFKADNADRKEYDKMIEGLTDIMSTSFPDGIHINPVLRTANNEERYQGDAPFVVPTGNVDDDFIVDVEVQTPTIFINPQDIDFRNADVVLNESEDLVKEFATVKDEINARIKKLVPDLPAFIELKQRLEIKSNATYNLDADNLNDINQILKGKTLKELIDQITEDVIKNLQVEIESLSDNVINENGIDSLVKMDESGMSVSITPIEQEATNFAKQQLTEIQAPEQNITINYTSINKLDSTEKLREFSILNVDNGEIIATFVYENKAFTPLNYLNPLPTSPINIAPLIKGTFVEPHYEKLNMVFNDINIIANLDSTGKVEIGKAYFLVGSYLKLNGFEEELKQLSTIYDNLLKQTKC